jgi:hypothetical protein
MKTDDLIWFNEISRLVGHCWIIFFLSARSRYDSQGNWGAGRTKVGREDDMEQVEE